MESTISSLPQTTLRTYRVLAVDVTAINFDTFYRTEYPAMVAIARSVVGDSSVAEDLAQEAFTKAHENWHKISKYDKPGAWLRRVTINLAVSRRRRVQREFSVLRKKSLERKPAQPKDHDDELWNAVSRLPARQRAAVALFYLEDRTTREIAEILGCTISTATSHLNLARHRLARDLGDSIPNGDVR